MKKFYRKSKIDRKAAYVAYNMWSSVKFEGQKVRKQLSVPDHTMVCWRTLVETA